MYTNQEILKIAMQQSAWDLGCDMKDFLNPTNVVARFESSSLAKKYYEEPIACNFVSYGNNLVLSVKDEYRKIVEEYIRKYDFYHCFETPNLHWLDDRLRPLGQRVCFMAEYFLPDMKRMKRLSCDYRIQVLEQQELSMLYLPEWSNALCEKRKELDVLGVGAYDGSKLIGLAGCSADCDCMWQIGVDVLPEYRRQGIACTLTSHLAMEILEKDRVPFYCCAWSNIRSARNANKSGFVPAWVEMTVKPERFVEEMNR